MDINTKRKLYALAVRCTNGNLRVTPETYCYLSNAISAIKASLFEDGSRLNAWSHIEAVTANLPLLQSVDREALAYAAFSHLKRCATALGLSEVLDVVPWEWDVSNNTYNPCVNNGLAILQALVQEGILKSFKIFCPPAQVIDAHKKNKGDYRLSFSSTITVVFNEDTFKELFESVAWDKKDYILKNGSVGYLGSIDYQKRREATVRGYNYEGCCRPLEELNVYSLAHFYFNHGSYTAHTCPGTGLFLGYRPPSEEIKVRLANTEKAKKKPNYNAKSVAKMNAIVKADLNKYLSAMAGEEMEGAYSFDFRNASLDRTSGLPDCTYPWTPTMGEKTLERFKEYRSKLTQTIELLTRFKSRSDKLIELYQSFEKPKDFIEALRKPLEEDARMNIAVHLTSMDEEMKELAMLIAREE